MVRDALASCMGFVSGLPTPDTAHCRSCYGLAYRSSDVRRCADLTVQMKADMSCGCLLGCQLPDCFGCAPQDGRTIFLVVDCIDSKPPIGR